MSTASTTHHPHLPGPTAGAALATAAVVGALTLLGAALSHAGDTTPLAPTVECNSAACAGPHHPVLRGRHHGRSPAQGFPATPSGGRPVLGQP